MKQVLLLLALLTIVTSIVFSSSVVSSKAQHQTIFMCTLYSVINNEGTKKEKETKYYFNNMKAFFQISEDGITFITPIEKTTLKYKSKFIDEDGLSIYSFGDKEWVFSIDVYNFFQEGVRITVDREQLDFVDCIQYRPTPR